MGLGGWIYEWMNRMGLHDWKDVTQNDDGYMDGVDGWIWINGWDD